jgi:hypothetical protein
MQDGDTHPSANVLQPSVKRLCIPCTLLNPQTLSKDSKPDLEAQMAETPATLIPPLTGIGMELIPYVSDFANPFHKKYGGGAQAQMPTPALQPDELLAHTMLQNNPSGQYSWVPPPHKFSLLSSVNQPEVTLSSASALLPGMAQRKVPSEAGPNHQVKQQHIQRRVL